MISKKTKYALNALMVLGQEYEKKEPLLISCLAERAKVPKKFLEQILLDLKNKGILESRRGKGGGYLLGKDPSEIKMGTILRVFEGPLAPLPCLSFRMGFRKCDECEESESCAIRRLMKEWHDAQLMFFENQTLRHMLDKRNEPIESTYTI